jgi:hypothetical protein
MQGKTTNIIVFGDGRLKSVENDLHESVKEYNLSVAYFGVSVSVRTLNEVKGM